MLNRLRLNKKTAIAVSSVLLLAFPLGCHAQSNNARADNTAAGKTVKASEFDAAREIWENHFGPEPPAMSAAEMRGPFPVPGCSVLLDVVAGVAD